MIRMVLRWLRFAALMIIAITVTVILTFVFLIIVLSMKIVAYFTTIPSWVGKYLSVSELFRWALDRFIGFQILETVRDDLIQIYYPYLDIRKEPDHDRWWLLHDIESSQEEINRRLESGETSLSIAGGVISIVLGSVFGIGVGAIAISILAIVLSFLVTIRIIAIESLSFELRNHPNVSTRDLVLFRGWNSGPMQNDGAVLIVLLSVFLAVAAKPESYRYNMAMSFLSSLIGYKYSNQISSRDLVQSLLNDRPVGKWADTTSEESFRT